MDPETHPYPLPWHATDAEDRRKATVDRREGKVGRRKGCLDFTGENRRVGPLTRRVHLGQRRRDLETR